MPTAKVVLDTTQYVKINSVAGSFTLQSHRDTVRIVFSDIKPARGNDVFHELGGSLNETFLPVPYTETVMWALAMTDTSSLSVTNHPPAQTVTTDSSDRVAMVSMTGESHVGFKVDDISVNFQYGISTNDIVSGGTATGTGVIDTDKSMATVSSGTGVGSATLESVDSVRYRAGHECQAATSIIFGTPEVNVNQYAGFLNGADGWCPGYQGLDFGMWFIEGSNVNFIKQTDFNIDKLDGNGPSQYNINPQTGQLYRPTYTWHGFLDMLIEVRTTDGRWVPAHKESFVNSATETHLENPNLPITVKVERLSGTGADITIKTGSWRGGVIAGVEEVNRSDRWFPFFNLEQTVVSTANTGTHLISLRSKAMFQSKVNHIKSDVKILVSTSSHNKDLIVVAFPTVLLRANDPTFAALLDAAYNDVNTQNSVMEVAKTPPITVDITGLGEDTFADVALVKAADVRSNLDVQGFSIYPQDELSFVVLPPLSGTGAMSIQGNFKELH